MVTEPDVGPSDASADGAVGDGSGGVAFDTTVHRPSVLVVDDEIRADLFEHWLAEDFHVRTATSRSETFEEFDETVAVAIVRNELKQEFKEELQDQIAATVPFCRTIITTTEKVEIMFPGLEYDVCLTEPTNRETVRETVYHLMLRARYDANLRNYYQCSIQAANMEVQLVEAELAESDRYERLRRRMGNVKQHLEAILHRFDPDDLDAVQQSIKPDVGFGRETSEKNDREGDKYQPDACVSCGLEWGIDHGGDLGTGSKRLGSFVWECTKCGSVQNLPDPSHRRVAWR